MSHFMLVSRHVPWEGNIRVYVMFHTQSNLRKKDTLGAEVLSFVWRLSYLGGSVYLCHLKIVMIEDERSNFTDL